MFSRKRKVIEPAHTAHPVLTGGNSGGGGKGGGGQLLLSDIVESSDDRVLFPDRSPSRPPKKVPYRVFVSLILPGGRTLVGGAPDGSIDIIHPETGAIELTIRGHSDSVMALAISPHGLFSAGADREVRRWSLKDFSETKVYYGHEGMVTAMVLAPIPGNTGLITTGDDMKIYQWNVETAVVIEEYTEHKAAVNVLRATSQLFFSGDGAGQLHVYDLAKRQILNELNAHETEIWCLEYNEEDDLLFSGGGDGTVRIWTGVEDHPTCQAELFGHAGPVRALVEDQGILFTGGADSLVSCWDCRNTEQPRLKEVWRMYNETMTMTCKKPITSMGFANNELVAVGFDKIVNRWDVTTLLVEPHDIIDLPPLNAIEELKNEEKQATMLPQERHFIYCQADVDESIKKYTELPINYIIESLNYKVEGSWLTSELIVFIPFLIMFLFFFIWDLDSKEVFYMNEGLASMLEAEDFGQFKLMRTFMDIDKTSLWVTWVTTLFFGQFWGGKGATEWYEPFRFQGSNQLIGAVRFRTQRVTNNSCSINSEMFNTNLFNDTAGTQLPCYGVHHGITGEGIEKDPYACQFPGKAPCQGHNATNMRNVLNFTSGQFEYTENVGTLYRGLKFYPPGGYVVDIPGMLSETDAQHRAQVMVDNGFVDDIATRFIAIEFFHYNPTLQVYSFNRLMVEAYAGGGMVTNVRHIPFKVFRLDTSRWKLIYEIVFLLFIFYWFVNWFTNLRRHYKMYGGMMGYILNMWNFLDMLNVIVFFVMFGFRWQWFSMSQTALVQMPFDNSRYPDELDDIVGAYQVQVNLNAVNTIITFIKLLKYMQLNDQLNVLTRTMAAAQQNIVGVLTLFIHFVLSFAITGMAIYGNNVFGFRTLDAAYNTLLRVLVGDQDYEAMSLEAREITLGFYWAFIICAQFMLLNFLIAVLSDAFQDVVNNRLPISLDKAIIRAANLVKRNFLPGVLRITILLIYQRNSRTNLTAKQARILRKYRETLLSEEAKRFKDYDELDHWYVTKDWFTTHVPKELKSDDNLNFMDEVWFDMSWEWHFRLRDKVNQLQHEHTEIIEEVLRAELNTLSTKGGFLEDCTMALSSMTAKIKALSSEL